MKIKILLTLLATFFVSTLYLLYLNFQKPATVLPVTIPTIISTPSSSTVETISYSDSKFGYSFQCPAESKHEILIITNDGTAKPYKSERCLQGTNQFELTVLNPIMESKIESSGEGAIVETKMTPNGKYLIKLRGFDKSYFSQILSTFKFTDTAAKPTSTLKTYSSDKYGISFQYPQNVKVAGVLDSQVFTLILGNETVSFQAQSNPQGYDSKDFFLRLISPDNPDSIANYVSFSDVKIGNNNFVLSIQDPKYFEQQSPNLKSYLVNGNGYYFSFGFSQNSGPLINQILSTLKFTQ